MLLTFNQYIFNDAMRRSQTSDVDHHFAIRLLQRKIISFLLLSKKTTIFNVSVPCPVTHRMQSKKFIQFVSLNI